MEWEMIFSDQQCRNRRFQTDILRYNVFMSVKEKNLHIYYVNFKLKPLSEELILKNINEANAKCYTIASDADEAIGKIKSGFSTMKDWAVNRLLKISTLTMSDLDLKLHNQEHVIQAVTDARVVVDLEMWVEE